MILLRNIAGKLREAVIRLTRKVKKASKNTGLDLVGESGCPLLYSIVIDGTARKQAEATLRQQSEALRRQNDEPESFNRAAVGRKPDMIDRKRQVNGLSLKLGLAAPFNLAFADAPPALGNEPKDSHPPAAGAQR